MAFWTGPVLDFIVVILTLNYVSGFNVDTNIPVVKTGPANSYFGYSIAEHIIASRNKILLVGAPLANNPKSLDVRQQPKGGVLKCSAGNWAPNDCEFIGGIEEIMGTKGNMTDMWMGSTIINRGANSKVVVCANRYTMNYAGTGTCVLLENDLVPDEEKRACSYQPEENKGLSYCQAGTSGVLTKDDDLILGAPGAVDWRGGLFKMHVGDDLTADLSWIRSAVYEVEDEYKKPPIDVTSYLGMAVTSGKFDSLSNTIYVGGAPRSVSKGQVVFFRMVGTRLTYRENQILTGEQPFSAFGYSLLAIDLNNDGYDELIVGCPMYLKPGIGGAIYIYKGGPDGITGLSKPQRVTLDMETDECQRLNCEDSRFGISLASVGDINLDGYQDFVVGAPYEGEDPCRISEDESKPPCASPKPYPQGAIYVYHGSASGVVEKYVQKISAEQISPNLMTFGFSLSGGLDMDDNGYPDIMVGAYESNTAVMLRTRPVVNLASRIDIFPKMFNLSESPRCPADGSLRYCVTMKVCLTFEAKPIRSFNTPLSINYRIEAEPERPKKRVEFKNKLPSYPTGDIVTEDRMLRQQQREECFGQIVYLKPHNDFQDKLSPVQFKLTYSLAKTAWEKRSASLPFQALPDINKHPVLQLGDQMGDLTTSVDTKIEFAKECGSNEICESILDLEAVALLPVDNGVSVISNLKDILKVKVKITNTGEPAYETGLFFVVPEKFEWDGEEAMYKEEKDKFTPNCFVFNKTILACKGWGNPLYKSLVREFKVKFSLKNLNPDIREFQINVILNTTSNDRQPEIERTLMVKVINRANVVLIGSAQPDRDLVYSGEVRGESAIDNEQQIGPAINHTYEIIIEGNGTLPEAELRIDWPYELQGRKAGESGKHLLYIMEPPKVLEGDAECFYDTQMYNPLGVTENPDYMIVKQLGPAYTVSNRKRREVNYRREKREDDQMHTTTEKSTAEDKVRIAEQREKKKNVVILDCEKGNVRCYELKCFIKRMTSADQVKIVIRARLWESTFLEDYPDVDMVKVISRGRIILDPDLNIQQTSTEDDKAEAITYAIPGITGPPISEIKWWIILVAVLGGIILLVVLILILFKCGFFKRIKPADYEPTYQGEIKKKNKDYDNVD